MTEILLSIVVPCYNATIYIQRCLESLLNQDLDNYEIICVNDASTDNTLGLLQEYERKYPNIRVISHECNKRQGGARNTGIKNARGRYIGFVDIDDSVDSFMYSTLCNEAIKYDLDVAEVDYRVVNMDGSQIEEHVLYEDVHNDIKEDLRKQLMVVGGSVWCKIYKREFLLKNNLFFPEGLFFEDNYFVPLVYANMSSYSYLRKVCYNYYINPSSTTNKKNSDNLYDRFLIAQKLINDFKDLGLDSIYKEELDFLVILNAFSGTFFMTMRNYTYVNYKLLNNSKQFIMNYLPNFEKNKWYKYKYSRPKRLLFAMAKINTRLFVVMYKLGDLLRKVKRKIV